jgi:hypothetical protein
MRSSDLTPYIANGGASGDNWRQGVVVSWNPDDASNVVQVGGSLFENLPILNTSEASLLSTGDPVAVVGKGSSFAIIGRMVIPGTPEAVSSIQSITNRWYVAKDPSAGSRNSTAWGDLTGTAVGPSVTARITSSGKAAVFWSAELGQVLNTAGTTIQYEYRNTPHVGVQISGATSVPAADGAALNFNVEHIAPGFTGHALTSFWAQCGTFFFFEDLNPGDTTFTLKYKHDTLAPSSGVTSYFSSRQILVFAM